jgi:hypothetical protein
MLSMDTGMDMGSMSHGAAASQSSASPSSGMGMSMSTIFSTNTRVTLFFTEWTTTTIAGYLATIACLFFLTLLNRFLSALRFQTERAWLAQAQDTGFSSLAPGSSNGRRGVHAKASPVPPYLRRDDDSECDPLNAPNDGEPEGSWAAAGKEQDTKRRYRLSLSRIFGAWQPSGLWSFQKDGTRALMEFTRAFIGYILYVAVVPEDVRS